MAEVLTQNSPGPQVVECPDGSCLRVHFWVETLWWLQPDTSISGLRGCVSHTLLLVYPGAAYVYLPCSQNTTRCA